MHNGPVNNHRSNEMGVMGSVSELKRRDSLVDVDAVMNQRDQNNVLPSQENQQSLFSRMLGQTFCTSAANGCCKATEDMFIDTFQGHEGRQRNQGIPTITKPFYQTSSDMMLRGKAPSNQSVNTDQLVFVKSGANCSHNSMKLEELPFNRPKKKNSPGRLVPHANKQSSSKHRNRSSKNVVGDKQNCDHSDEFFCSSSKELDGKKLGAIVDK